MSRDTILRDDEGNTYSLDSLATQKWLEGHYSGLDQCCTWLEQRAVGLFAQRKHKEAMQLQELADKMKRELKPQMVKRSEEHEKDFPWRLESESAMEKKAS